MDTDFDDGGVSTFSGDEGGGRDSGIGFGGGSGIDFGEG